MNSSIKRLGAPFGMDARLSASALQTIALLMPHAADLEPELALVSAADRASLVHIWSEKWCGTPCTVEPASSGR